MSATVFRDLEAVGNYYIKCLISRFSVYTTKNLERKLKMKEVVKSDGY